VNRQAAAALELARRHDQHLTNHILADTFVDSCAFCRMAEAISEVDDPQQRDELWNLYNGLEAVLMNLLGGQS